MPIMTLCSFHDPHPGVIAMVITGVHLDEKGNPVRFKVENSWGEAWGKKGYFVMTAEWFDE